MDCPRCATALATTANTGDPYRDAARDVESPCASCGGIFLPLAAFDATLEQAGVATRWTRESETLPDLATNLLLRCPGCKATMTKCRQRAKKLVLYDQCAKCGGLWFDRGELESIIATLAAETVTIPRH